MRPSVRKSATVRLRPTRLPFCKSTKPYLWFLIKTFLIGTFLTLTEKSVRIYYSVMWNDTFFCKLKKICTVNYAFTNDDVMRFFSYEGLMFKNTTGSVRKINETERTLSQSRYWFHKINANIHLPYSIVPIHALNSPKLAHHFCY